MRKSFCVAASSAALAGEVDEMATGADSIFKSWQAYVFINHLEINLTQTIHARGNENVARLKKTN